MRRVPPEVADSDQMGEADEDAADQPITAGLVMTLKDLKVYCITFSLTACVVGLSFNAYFPTLTATLGERNTRRCVKC